MRMGGCVARCLFSTNNFVTSAALAAVCALLSVILVFKFWFHYMIKLSVCFEPS